MKRKASTLIAENKRKKINDRHSNETSEKSNKQKEYCKKKVIENVQMAVSLNIVSKFYNINEKTLKRPSKRKLNDIVNNHNIANLEDIKKVQFPAHFSINNSKLANIFKYTLYGFGITLNNSQTNPLFEEKKKTIENIQALLLGYLQNPDISTLIYELRKEGLKLDKKYENIEYQIDATNNVSSYNLRLKTIDNLIFSSIIPPFRNSMEESEMELTRLYFAPIMGFTSIFSGCSGGSNSSIQDFVGSLDGNLQASIPDFRPDDITIVTFKNSYKCIRVIREDSSDIYQSHTSHKDFIALISQMKIALSHAMRQLIKKDIEEWHNQVLVLGITTDRQASHLYSLHCSSISLNGKSITLSNFTLSFIGSYKHEVVMDRIHLIARIMTALIYPNNEEVTEYLTTQRQISMMSSNQKNEISFPKLDADNQLIEYDKNFDPIQTRSTLKKGKINGVEYFIKYQPNININEDSIRYNFLTLYAPMIDGNFSLSLAGKCMTRFFNKGKKINIMAFFIDLLVQLCFLQKHQITHNDIKPENIVLYDKHWFLIDFEIATKFSLEDGICVDKNLNPLTSKNFSEGYRSPERVEKNLISPKSDIYSLGMVLLEIIHEERLEFLEDEETVEGYLEDVDLSNDESIILSIIKKKILVKSMDKRMDAFSLLDLLFIPSENNATPQLVHLKQKAKIVKTYFQDKDYFLRKNTPKHKDSVIRTLAF